MRLSGKRLMTSYHPGKRGFATREKVFSVPILFHLVKVNFFTKFFRENLRRIGKNAQWESTENGTKGQKKVDYCLKTPQKAKIISVFKL